MAKKKAAGGPQEGTAIRVKVGVMSPDFPDVSFSGWTGIIAEVAGKSPNQKLYVEWDQATTAAMPPDYVSRCEAQMLLHTMACLSMENVEPLA